MKTKIKAIILLATIIAIPIGFYSIAAKCVIGFYKEITGQNEPATYSVYYSTGPLEGSLEATFPHSLKTADDIEAMRSAIREKLSLETNAPIIIRNLIKL